MICSDNHVFVFLRTEEKEVGFRRWEKFDVFFCLKCLKYERRLQESK